MLSLKPKYVWAVSVAVSVLFHMGAVAFAGYAWNGKPAKRKEPTRLSHRDVSFLLGYLRAAAKTILPPVELRDVAPPAKLAKVAGAPASVLAASGAVPMPPPRARPEAAAPPAPKPEPPKPKAPQPPVPDVADPPLEIDANVARALKDSKEMADLGPRAILNTDFYKQKAKQRVERNISVLLGCTPEAMALRGSVLLIVVVRKDGTIVEFRYEKHSDYPVLDVIAEQCILRSAPFLSFYKGMETEYLPMRFRIRF